MFRQRPSQGLQPSLIGMTTGYILSVILGLISFSGIGGCLVCCSKAFAFGVKFDLGYILMFVPLYFIVAVQMIGDFNVSCMGGLDREPTPDEIGGGATANGIPLPLYQPYLTASPPPPTARTPVSWLLTKACSRFVILVGCGILFLAGLCPKVGAGCPPSPTVWIGGGTVVVFCNDCHLRHEASCQGRILQPELPDYRRIPGIRPGHLVLQRRQRPVPAGIAAMLEENSGILTSLLAIILNLVFPKDPVAAAEKEGKAQ